MWWEVSCGRSLSAEEAGAATAHCYNIVLKTGKLDLISTAPLSSPWGSRVKLGSAKAGGTAGGREGRASLNGQLT